MPNKLFFAAAIAFGFSVSLVATAPLVNASAGGVVSSFDAQEAQGDLESATQTNPVTASFSGPPNNGDTIVVAVAYGNKKNRNHIAVSGLGVTFTAGYAAPLKRGFGIAFFYGTSTNFTGSTVTVAPANLDNLSVFIEDWVNLNPVEDKKARAIKASSKAGNTTITASGKTKNANDVVFMYAAYNPIAYPTPSTGDFLDMGISTNTSFAPYTTGGYAIMGSAGKFTNSFTMNGQVTWAAATMALETAPGPNTLFQGTPLTDLAASQLYENQFPGQLYCSGPTNNPTQENCSNDLATAAPTHDTLGKNFAAEVQPLNATGQPSSTGQIGVVGIGVSNFNEELCTGNNVFQTPPACGQFGGTGCLCDPGSFLNQASALSNINPQMVLVDCAQSAEYAVDWDDPTLTGPAWSNCLGVILPQVYNITPAQVQVVIVEAGEKDPPAALGELQGRACPNVPNPQTDPDACVYEYYVSQISRILKGVFPNLKQIFLQQRIFAGYAQREPFSYEIGIANRWLIQAQINEEAGLGQDPLAGDVEYSDGSTAWMGWSAYTWADGPTPSQNGDFWIGGDYEWDGVHPSQCRFEASTPSSHWQGTACGRTHSATEMMNFYTTSPYTMPWFLAPAS